MNYYYYKEAGVNAIGKALSEVYFNIPLEILNLGFNDIPQGVISGLDEAIMTRVIRPRVLIDCNLLGGREVYIPLNRCNITHYGNGVSSEYLIDVPKALTANKSIVSALGLFGTAVTPTNGMHVNTQLTQALQNQMNIGSMPPVIATARLEIVGENKVLVEDPTATFIAGSLKCVVENNDNLSNISPRSYIDFARMVVIAVKAYIHNYLIVKMGKGYIYNGHELGVVTDIINDYSSANDEYATYIKEVWTKVSFCNDKTGLRNYIVGMI